MDAMRLSPACFLQGLVWGPLILGLLGFVAGLQLRQGPPDTKCGDKEYYEPKHQICCSRCPPGMFVTSRCDKQRNTTCGVCPPGSFNEFWNHIEQCQLCRQCDEVLGFEEVTPCNASKKTQCRCRQGMYCPNQGAECEHCEPLSPCPPGTEPELTGRAGEADNNCVPCKNGYFQNISSPDIRCQPHTNCEAQGLVTAVSGTAESDARCQISPWKMPGTILLLYILIPLASILLLIIVFSYAWKRHPSLCQKLGALLKRRPEREDLNPAPNQDVPGANQKFPDLVEPLLKAVGAAPPAPNGLPPPVVETEILHQHCSLGQGREQGTEPEEQSQELLHGTKGMIVTGGSVTVTGNIYIYNGLILGGTPGPGEPLHQPEPPYPIPEEGTPNSLGFTGPHQEDGKAWHLAESETLGRHDQ
ncbi:tumor necrosis factor receptor superfamily member 3 isoform X1 [Antechinus flavipes]|uniref:tumor necrosis factor receptor superfamily member 3 isoform X1 n=2 Tax=Antechinus flavipes TaxID=38775 RepID=UPI002235A897|nr:tumor necrosis factor receptor superfamily member 3 isoform X1 [Antechinus flavipes]